MVNITDYHVWVKDYYWIDGKVPVQSPVLRLKKPGPPPVFRPKEGNNRWEPRVAATRDELSDDIGTSEYFSEAHGVLVPDKTRGPYIPLWMTYQQTSRATKGMVPFVDLKSSTCRSAPISRICWVPDYKSRDGKLYTVIGGTRRWQCGQVTTFTNMVCVQDEGSPQDAEITWIPSDDLSRLEKVDRFEKRRLFDIHLRLIIGNCNALSPIMSSMFKIARSEYSKDNGRSALDLILATHRHSHSTSQPRSDRECDLLEDVSDEGSSDGDSPQPVNAPQPTVSHLYLHLFRSCRVIAQQESVIAK